MILKYLTVLLPMCPAISRVEPGLSWNIELKINRNDFVGGRVNVHSWEVSDGVASNENKRHCTLWRAEGFIETKNGRAYARQGSRMEGPTHGRAYVWKGLRTAGPTHDRAYAWLCSWKQWNECLTARPDCKAWLQGLTAMPDCRTGLQCLTAEPDSNAWLQCLTAGPNCKAWLQCLTARHGWDFGSKKVRTNTKNMSWKWKDSFHKSITTFDLKWLVLSLLFYRSFYQ